MAERTKHLLRLLLAALASALLRVALTVAGAAERLAWRVEVSTPANSLLKIREGLTLQHEYGVSPYSGSSCHTPPLGLWIYAASAQHSTFYVVPNVVFDLLAGVLLHNVAVALLNQLRLSSATGLLSPIAVACCYWFNPLSVMSCVSGSLTPLENLSVIAAVYFASHKHLMGTSFALVAAAYISLHPALLTVAVVCLYVFGPEDVCGELPQQAVLESAAPPPPRQPRPAKRTKEAAAQTGLDELTAAGAAPEAAAVVSACEGAGDANSHPGGETPTSETAAVTDTPAPRCGQAAGTVSNKGTEAADCRTRGSIGDVLSAASLLAAIAMWVIVAAVASDLVLYRFSESQCVLPVLQPVLQPWLAGTPLAGMTQIGSSSSSSTRSSSSQSGVMASVPVGCWALQAYRLHVLMEDVVPTIGQWWYIFMEMFDDSRALFVLLAHSLPAVLVVPLAIRLGRRRPLALVACQLIAITLHKPYPSVGDVALGLALLPLLRNQQLRLMRLGVLMVSGLGLLCVLGPAMWSLWIGYESANSNFYYSITLVFAVWQVVLLGQLLGLTLQVDQLLQSGGQTGGTGGQTGGSRAKPAALGPPGHDKAD